MSSIGNASSSRFYGDLFVPFLFLLFNFGDLVGRVGASWKTIIAPKHIWIAVTLRLAFIPLFLLCHRSTSGAWTYTPFESDAWPLIFMTIFSVTNGYFSTQVMMYGPAQVGTNQINQAKAGTFMAFCLTAGIAVGSITSFALVPLTG